VGACCHYLPLIENGNFIYVKDCRQAMGDNHRGTSVHQLLQGKLYLVFTL
jgi:hypothetical protein